MTGLVIDGSGFEVLAGDERIGSRRSLGPADVELLAGLAGRYVRAVQARSDHGVLVELGRELYRWLDGDQGQLAALLEQADRPVVFEITGPRSPSEAGWAVLRAPFELLAAPGHRDGADPSPAEKFVHGVTLSSAGQAAVRRTHSNTSQNPLKGPHP
jgi:hypothetical protein